MNRRHIRAIAFLTLLFHAGAPHPAFATGAGVGEAILAVFLLSFFIPVPALVTFLCYAEKGTRWRKAGFGVAFCLFGGPVLGLIGGLMGDWYGWAMLSLLLLLCVVGSHQNKKKQAGKALSDTHKQAAAGDPLSQDHVAYSYYAGNGVPPDMAESYFWYSLSAANFRAAGNGETAKAQEGKRAICREQLSDQQAAEQDKRLADWRPKISKG